MFLHARERANKPALAEALGREAKITLGDNNLFGDREAGPKSTTAAVAVLKEVRNG